jgi:BNR repeat-like domain
MFVIASVSTIARQIVGSALFFIPLLSWSQVGQISAPMERTVVTTNLLQTARTSPKSTCATFESDGSISCVYLNWAGPATRIDLFEIRSNDGGVTWTSPVAITSNPGDEYDPYVEYDPVHKKFWLAYAKWHDDRGGAHNDVVLRHKDCPECVWSVPVVIAGDGKNDYWIPSVLSLSDGTVVVFYSKNGPESSFGVGSGSIELKRSADNGITWGQAIGATTVCDAEYARAIQNSFGSVLLVYGRYVDSSHLPKGTKCADGTNNHYSYTDIHQTWSADGGKTWSPESILYHTADGSAFHPSIGAENSHPETPCATCRWDLFFIKSTDGGFSVYRMQSSDQGLHWTDPIRYSNASWKSPFNVDPGFTEGCKGAIVNFTSGYGTDAVLVHREVAEQICTPK